MIDITACTEYFEEVKKFAVAIGKEENFLDKIDYLHTYATNQNERQDLEKTKCVLTKDWAPNSFAFTMYLRDKNGEYQYWFSGGLIFFQKNESGVGGSQYSVRLNSSDTGWEIHT